MFEGKVTAWCLFRKHRGEQRRQDQYLQPLKNPPLWYVTLRHVVSHRSISSHSMSMLHSVPFFALMWPGAEWSPTLNV